MTVKQSRGDGRSARRGAQRVRFAVARDVVSTVGEIGRMVWARRLWWLIPVLLTLVLLGGLFAVSSSPVAPLFYPLF